MMNEPPKAPSPDELCPICKKPKSMHTPEEVLECSRKMRDTEEKTD